jgi:hypothetical protein
MCKASKEVLENEELLHSLNPRVAYQQTSVRKKTVGPTTH